MDLNMILVCVEYADLLSITLPYNRHHFNRVTVVTTSYDLDTHRVAKDNDAQLYVTDSFYKDGAKFNKWRALEEGLVQMGRSGWLCIMDADILWPKVVHDPSYVIGNLYTPLRRMLYNLNDPIPEERYWLKYPLHPQQREWAGYSQIFHGSDPVLGRGPWHETNWKHAGGADSFFQAKWSATSKLRPGFQVLHLGEAGQNWCGRVAPFVGGDKPAEAEERYATLRGYIHQRRPGPSRFDHEKFEQKNPGS